MVSSNLGKFGKKRFWGKHIIDWKKTGLSQADYCRANKISLKSFQYWNRKARQSDVPALVEIPIVKSAAVSISHCSWQLCVVVDRYRVEIGKGFDSEDLERVVRILGRI